MRQSDGPVWIGTGLRSVIQFRDVPKNGAMTSIALRHIPFDQGAKVSRLLMEL